MKLNSRELQWKQCSLVFQTEEKLEIHEDRFHSETEPLKKCPHCETHFHEKNFKPHVYYCQNKEKIAEKRKQLKAQSVPTSPALSTISTTSFMSYQPGPSSFRSPLASPIVSYRDKSCAVCGETFASRQSMLRHVGRKHPDVKNDPNVTAVRYVSTESVRRWRFCQKCDFLTKTPKIQVFWLKNAIFCVKISGNFSEKLWFFDEKFSKFQVFHWKSLKFVIQS